MARIIIRALAQPSKAARLNLAEEEDPDSLDVTRRVINATADELEQANMTWQAVKWLRAQAEEE